MPPKSVRQESHSSATIVFCLFACCCMVLRNFCRVDTNDQWLERAIPIPVAARHMGAHVPALGGSGVHASKLRPQSGRHLRLHRLLCLHRLRGRLCRLHRLGHCDASVREGSTALGEGALKPELPARRVGAERRQPTLWHLQPLGLSRWCKPQLHSLRKCTRYSPPIVAAASIVIHTVRCRQCRHCPQQQSQDET